MKKFKYRMEALLKMKEHIEKDRQKILALSQKKVLDQKDKLSETDENNKQTLNKQKNIVRQPFSVAELLIYSRYIQKLKRDRLLGEQMLNVLEQDEDKKRKVLLEAARERKKYGKLKEKQQDNYYREIELSNAKETDEIAVNSFRLRKAKSKN